MFGIAALIVAAIAALACLAFIDQTGYVTINPTVGSAGGRTRAQNVVAPPVEDREYSFSELTEGIMAQLDSAAYVVIDTVNRKIHFTDDATAAGTLQTRAMFEAEIGVEAAELSPVVGQTGKTLAWTKVNDPASDEHLSTAIDDILAPVTPRYSVGSLLRQLLAAQEGGVSRCPKIVIVDQGAKKIIAHNGQSAVDELDGGTAPTTGNTGVIEVSASDTPTSPVKLPFEGGAV